MKPSKAVGVVIDIGFVSQFQEDTEKKNIENMVTFYDLTTVLEATQ